MSLRSVQLPAEQEDPREDRLMSIEFLKGGRIEATWAMSRRRGGNPRRVRIPVSPNTAAAIMARAGVQTILDHIRDDTYPRARAATG